MRTPPHRRACSRTPGTALATLVFAALGCGNRSSPIVYGMSIPTGVPHKALAQRFLTFLFSNEGQRMPRASQFDALATPITTGSAPADIVAGVPRAEEARP